METFFLITIVTCCQIVLGQILELPDENERNPNNGFNSNPEESREGQGGNTQVYVSHAQEKKIKEVLEKSNKCDEK